LWVRESSAVTRVEFDSDRLSYRILRGYWCHIIVLNVHVPTEDKIVDVADSFREELERVFDKFPKYHMKIPKYLRKTFSNQQLGMKIYAK
jgi:hypothetical protein